MASDNENEMVEVITGIGLTSQSNWKQSGFKCILRTSNSNEEANLWSSGILSRRSRFLCYSSENIKSCDPNQPILVNMVVIDDGDHVPENHQSVPHTLDSGERALKRKVLCVKFLPYSTVTQAITKLIICSRTRRLPTGFISLSEINSMSICYKLTDMNSIKLNKSLDTINVNSTTLHPAPLSIQQTNQSDSTFAFSTTRRGTVHPLMGIPFELNRRYLINGTSNNHNKELPYVRDRTLSEIDTEFHYRFDQERFLLEA